MNRLNNKVIIVTGGSGLLGRTMLQRLREEGAIAINADIHHSTDLEEGLLHCDITDPSSVNKSIHSIMDKFGRIDGLVNNAYPRTRDWGTKFESIPLESWKQNVDWQLNSYFYFSQQVSQIMKVAKSGSIVNIASIYGIVGPDFSVYAGTEMTMPAAYSAIKGGLINLTRYMAAYLGPYQVRVNTVSPGGILDNQPASFVQHYENKVPMKRLGTAADIAPAVAFLLSDDAAYITGQNLAVDGGWTAI